MKANAMSLLALFESKQRLEVPLFQRRYVWGLEQQWGPLWEDVEHKFAEYLEGRKDAPVHFLGAMVLDQKQTPSTHVTKRQVIDGQQRLTTLQIFLAAFRDFCRANDAGELADECEGFTLNTGMMVEPAVECYKVWPTQLDRPDFEAIIQLRSRTAVETRYPLTKRPRKRHCEPRPRMVEAYLFFGDSLREFFIGSKDEPPLRAELSLPDRLGEAFQALKNALQVVAIDLETGDDAQVIFETLNARGEPLLPADLLRNYIFLRAARSGGSPEELYKSHWAPFEEPFWREEVRQGRLLRPRSDLFMQHYLSAQEAQEIPIKHLYAEYRHWIERKAPFANVNDELATLARYGKHFRRIAAPAKGDPVHRIAAFFARFDVGTAYPLLLHLLDAGISEGAWQDIGSILESYFLRRQVCGLTTKNYNKVLLTLLRVLKLGGDPVATAFAYFDLLPGESTVWPDDEMFFSAWTTRHAYGTLLAPRLLYVLTCLDEAMTDKRSERMEVTEDLTIEHLMPQAWVEHWPLPDGSSGLSGNEFYLAPEGDPRRSATQKRNGVLHQIGNLTLLSGRLNPGVSNGGWAAKRAAIREHSKLIMNKRVVENEVWNEESIERRSRELFEVAKAIWPRARK